MLPAAASQVPRVPPEVPRGFVALAQIRARAGATPGQNRELTTGSTNGVAAAGSANVFSYARTTA